MIRNIDIVFRLMALPFHIAVAQSWMLVAVIAAGYVAVAWFDVEPVRILIYGFVALATVGVAVSAQQWGSGALAGGIVVTAVLTMILVEPVFDRMLPKNPIYQVTRDIPVAFRFDVAGNSIFGEAVNRSADWLAQARVECQGFYTNGTPVEQPWTKAIAGHSWLPPEETTGRRKLFERPYDAERYDMDRTQCRITRADFREAPKAVPRFTYVVLPGSGFVQFTVTNDTDRTLTAIRFSCIQSGDIRVTFSTRPMFRSALLYALAPGDTLELVSERMFTTIRGCLIYSVDQ